MTHEFHELAIGGVTFAPFVTYLFAGLAVILLARPILHLVGFVKIFSHPSIAELSLYVAAVAALVLLA